MPSKVKLTDPVEILYDYGYLTNDTPYFPALRTAVGEFAEDESIGGQYNKDYLMILQTELKNELKIKNKKIKASKLFGRQESKTKADTTGTSTLAIRKKNVDSGKLIPAPENEKNQENLAIVLGGIDSIVKTLKDEKKQDKKHFSFLRKMVERFNRRKKEKKLEFKVFEGLKKAASTILEPVKSAWSKIIGFLQAVLLGRALFKIMDWMGNPDNKKKLDNILRFVKDYWPTMLAAYLLFGTGFTSMAVGLVKFIAWSTVKLLGLVPKLMAALAKLKLGKILKMIPGGPLLKGALLLGGTVATTYGIGKMLNKDKEAENLAAAQNQSTEKLIEEGMDPGEAATTSQSVVTSNSNRMTDTNLRSDNNVLQTGMNDPLGGGFNKFAQGGFVSGPAGVDKVPARLTAGEFVMSKGAVQKYGVNTLKSMNAAGGGTNIPTLMGGKPGYEGGGLVEVEAGSINSYQDAIDAGIQVEDTIVGNQRYGKIRWKEKMPRGFFGLGKQKYRVMGTKWLSSGFGSEHNKTLAMSTEDYVNMKMDWSGASSSSAKVEPAKPKMVRGQGNKLRAVPSKSSDPNIQPSEKRKVTVAYEEEKDKMSDKPSMDKPGKEIPSFDVTKGRSPQKMKVLGISV